MAKEIMKEDVMREVFKATPHLLNTAFNSFKSFASRRSFWAAFKSSRDAIAGMVYPSSRES